MIAQAQWRSDLGLLLRYAAWAGNRTYTALADVPATTLTAPTPIFAGSILRTLNHVRLISVVWKSHLLGMPHGFTTRNPETSPTFTELRAWQRDLDRWFIDYADRLSPRAAVESVSFTFIGGGNGCMTRAEILLHLANHASYHRGHLTAMLYQAGIPPPVTDLPVFLRDAPEG